MDFWIGMGKWGGGEVVDFGVFGEWRGSDGMNYREGVWVCCIHQYGL